MTLKRALTFIVPATVAAFLFTGCFEDTSSGSNNGSSTQYDTTAVDSLFTVLLQRIEDTEDTYNYVDFTIDNIVELEFQDLATQFYKYSRTGDMKASIGYVVSEMASLNKSTSLKKLADSLDGFFSQYDANNKGPLSGKTISRSQSEETQTQLPLFPVIGIELTPTPTRSTLVSRSYEKNGINGLSLALLSQTPSTIRATTVSTSFPKFITMSHIQDIIENEISSRLDKVITTLELIEARNATQHVTFTIFEEVTEIDIADIYLLEASLRILRGSLRLFTIRDLDLRSPYTGSIDYSWAKDMVDLFDTPYDNTTTYSLSSNGDTLFTHEVSLLAPSEKAGLNIAYDVVKYNLNRNDFGSIRNTNHLSSYEDFKAIPAKLKLALDALENENDSQEDDLIKRVDFDDLDAEMVDIKQILLDEGLSYELAQNFGSPRKVISFVEKLLTEPYTFHETISTGQEFTLTIDISKFFTNPVTNIKEYLPYYQLRDKNTIFTILQDSTPYNYTSSYPNNSFYVGTNYSTPTINIASDKIDTIRDYTTYQYVYLVDNFSTKSSTNDYEIVMPFDFKDNQGNIISFQDMLSKMENGEVPYFKDYTFNGVFPGMTREKWNTQLSNLMDAI